MEAEYSVDPHRLHALVYERTGVFVQAAYEGRMIRADICQLTTESLERYVRGLSRDELEGVLVRVLRTRTSSTARSR
jgi:hypothetical protein